MILARSWASGSLGHQSVTDAAVFRHGQAQTWVTCVKAKNLYNILYLDCNICVYIYLFIYVCVEQVYMFIYIYMYICICS